MFHSQNSHSPYKSLIIASNNINQVIANKKQDKALIKASKKIKYKQGHIKLNDQLKNNIQLKRISQGDTTYNKQQG